MLAGSGRPKGRREVSVRKRKIPPAVAARSAAYTRSAGARTNVSWRSPNCHCGTASSRCVVIRVSMGPRAYILSSHAQTVRPAPARRHAAVRAVQDAAEGAGGHRRRPADARCRALPRREVAPPLPAAVAVDDRRPRTAGAEAGRRTLQPAATRPDALALLNVP